MTSNTEGETIELPSVVGHHLEATLEEPTTLGRQLEGLANDLDIAYERDPYILITAGDVDWSETKQIRLRASHLTAMVEAFDLEDA